MRTITPTVVFNSRWVRWHPRNRRALTLGTTIYVRDATITDADLRHEAHHVRQYAQRGMWRGLCEYLLLGLLYGYDQHPWEQEARRAERGQCPAETCHGAW